MLIRAGMLFVPAIDEETSRGLRSLIRAHDIDIVVVTESQAGAQRNWIAEILRRWCDEEDLDLILTIGGTWPAPGHSDQEPVPEATLDVLERPLPGIADAMRRQAANSNRLALINRGQVGIRGRTMVINLPWGTESTQIFLTAIVDMIVPVVERLRDVDSGGLAQRDLLRAELKQVDGQDPSAHATHESANATSVNDTSANDARANEPQKTHGLDENEFAAFLRRKRDSGQDR